MVKITATKTRMYQNASGTMVIGRNICNALTAARFGGHVPASPETLGISEDDARRSRTCADCQTAYSVLEYLHSNAHYFGPPHRYFNGCLTRCLACWLGMGPDIDSQPTESVNLLRECGKWLKPGEHLIIMPLARATLDQPICLPVGVHLYPARWVELDPLNVVASKDTTSLHAEFVSAVSGVTAKTISDHVTVAFHFPFDWSALTARWSHASHMEFIRVLSEYVDRRCLDLIRYRQCRIDSVDDLPGRAGQLDGNHMMAGALLYNAASQEARVLCGAAFTHIATKGLGLPIEPLDDDDFPGEGELGHVVSHAHSLYSLLLEVNNPTAKFIQALSLLEFLADPLEYRPFKEVKKIVARYVARTPAEYTRLLERFLELTAKTDPSSKQVVGYRTRMVHLGERLDQIVPSPLERRGLFEELDRYIRVIIDHMNGHSGMTYDEYLKVREQMRPHES